MKKRPDLLFLLVMISLTGIVMFQVYWCVNAYKVDKKNFDANIDLAMQHAMDDCKKDYFDSIRKVLVRRVSNEVKIRIDTVHEKDTINAIIKIYMSNDAMNFGEPFGTTAPRLEFYRKKIDHKATLPEALVEMSFYVPALMNQFTMLLGMRDFHTYPVQFAKFQAYNNTHIIVPEDTMLKLDRGMDSSIYGFPKNVRQGDSLKLATYLKKELKKMDISSPFTLAFSEKSIKPGKINAGHSETGEYSYKYHGFKVFEIIGPEFFARAAFKNPQYAIVKGMTLILLLSLILIVTAVTGFNHLIKTIINQKKLADLKDDFINNMTHELKTPIATLTVAIEGLQRFNALNDPEKTQRYLQTSRNELVRLNDLVNKVLSVAAFESHEVKLIKESIGIDTLVQEVIASEKLKTGKNVEIGYTNRDNIRSIEADLLHLRNALTNLVDNAVKYSDEPVKINIACYRDGDKAVFSVKDNGPGIPASHLTQVFDKFHRVPTGNVHNIKGTGLGLSYVKYIVEAHGGNVSVKSEIGHGSEFAFSIPLP